MSRRERGICRREKPKRWNETTEGYGLDKNKENSTERGK